MNYLCGHRLTISHGFKQLWYRKPKHIPNMLRLCSHMITMTIQKYILEINQKPNAFGHNMAHTCAKNPSKMTCPQIQQRCHCPTHPQPTTTPTSTNINDDKQQPNNALPNQQTNTPNTDIDTDKQLTGQSTPPTTKPPPTTTNYWYCIQCTHVKVIHV